MDNQKSDCIIVGQGLAGTCLSFEFIRRNKRILVVDQDAGAKCSAVAAGTFNPLVFKSFTPTWMAPVLLPYLKSFYGDLGLYLGLSILNNRSVVKSMKSEDQRRLWMVKTDDEVSGQFMREKIAENVNGLHSDHGFGFVEKSGNIHVSLILEGLRNRLKEDGNLLSEPFDFDSLMISETGVEYKGYKAERIIFCQGHENLQNPFFKELPFVMAKGEILIIESAELKSTDIIHDRINIVPMENDTYWVGSTFSWDNLDLEKTEAGRSNLESQLNQILQVPFKVLEHKVGIRPTVKDRRPLIGMHAKHSSLGIFNGMGTRGIMLAPYFANHFAEHIYNGYKLNRELDIRRFNAKV